MTDFRPDYLVKYCNAPTGLQILEQRALRWGSPRYFRDPMALDETTPLPFTPEKLQQATVQAAVSMIFAKEPPRGSAPIHTAIRRWREEERFASPDEAEEVMGGLLAQVVKQRNLDLEEVMSAWQAYTRSLRICCFSSKPDIGLCWDHYAERHSGIAIRFNADNTEAFPKLHKLRYQRTRPSITTLNDELHAIIEHRATTVADQFDDRLTSKPEHAKDEREWQAFRNVATGGESSAEHPYTDISFAPEDVRAIYLGLNISPAVEEKLISLKKNHYRHAKLLRATLSPGRYQLDFEKI